MNRYLKVLGIGLFLTLSWIGTASAQQANNYWCSSATVPCPPSGWTPASAANPFPVTATITPSGTQNVNVTQILGAAPSLTNPFWVFPATGATFPVSSTANAPVAPATATATNSTLAGCQATSAAINPTTGQQAAVDCDLNNNLLVSAGGAPNLAIVQVSIATSDTLAVAARALRRAVTIQNITGTQQIYCNQTTATTGNGVLLPAVVGANFTFNTTSAIRCIAVTGAQTIAVAETF